MKDMMEIGYPSKLSGDAIPFFARIAAVADSFDAMTSKRVYRDSLPLEAVRKQFLENKGSQFDPQITDVFLDILDNYYSDITDIQNKYM